MKKNKRLSLNIIKVLFVVCTLFSQLSVPIKVFADEVKNNVNNNESQNNDSQNDNQQNDNQNNDSQNNNQQNDDQNNEQEIKEEETISYDVDDTNNIITIKGTLKSNLTKETLKKALSKNYSDANILDDKENSIEDSSVIKDNMKLSTNTKLYKIVVIGDINEDGIVDKKDLEEITKDILESKKPKYTLSDLTLIGNAINKGSWDSSTTQTDTLEGTISRPSSVLTGEEVAIEFSFEGFKKDSINGISGSFKYDKEYLELVKVEATDSLVGNYNEKNEFIYSFSKDKNKDLETLVTLTFKALKKGTTNVVIDNLKASNNSQELSLSSNNVNTNITIDTPGMGGDSSEEEAGNTNEKQTNKVVETITTEEEQPVKNAVVQTINNVPATTYVRPITLSSNNYINSLKIEGYEIDFDMYKYEYNIKVKHNVNSLDITVVLDSDYASYVIKGNEKFKDGNNEVEIVITAEDGSERTYTINVERTKDSKTIKSNTKEESTKGNASKTVIIILIILVIIGLIYVIFKDDEEEEIIAPKKNTNQTKKNSSPRKSTNNKKK